DLDARLEDLRRRRQVAELRRMAVDRPALGALGGRILLVDRVPEHVPETSERHVTDGNRDRLARVDRFDTACEAVGGGHGYGPDAVVAEMLLDLRDQRSGFLLVELGNLDAQRVVDLGKLAREYGVD